MQLRIWKRIYLLPFVRLNLYTSEFSISFGHCRIDWNTLSRHVIREILNTPLGVYL
jgi:hypothetical protein